MGFASRNGRRGAAHTVLLVLLAATSVNCFKDPVTPVPPSWDMDLTFPVGVKTVSVGDLITEDSTSLRADPANRLVFNVNAPAPSTRIGDCLSLRPSEAQSHVAIGAFTVEVKPMVTSINVPNIPPGQTAPVPSQTLAIPTVSAGSSTEGDVTFSSGTIGLSLKNNLPVTLTAVSPVQLVDDNGNVEAVFDLGGQPLAPGQDVTVYDDLAGRTLGNGFNLTGMSFLTPGSTSPVTMPADSMLVATLVLSNLRASTAQVTGIPAQRLTDNDRTTIALNDSTLIQMVSIRSGQLQFTFANQIGVGLLFKFRLPEVYRPGPAGPVAYEDSVFLPAGGTGTCLLDLAGARLQAPPGRLLNALGLTSSIIIPTAVKQPTLLHDTDKVQISMTTLAPLVADSVVGTIKPTWFNVNTSVCLNAGKIPSRLKGQFNIPSATLTFTALAAVGFPADLHLRLSAVKSSGERIYLDIPDGQRRLAPGNNTITFDAGQVGGFLSQLSGTIPDSLRLSGGVLVNPPDCYSTTGQEVGSVGSGSSLEGSIALAIPLNIGITQAAYRDTTAFAQSDDGTSGKPDQSELRKVNSAKLYLEVRNGLPAQVGVRVRLLDRMHQPLLMFPQSGQTLDVSAGTVDARGITAAPGVSTLVIDLNHAEVQQFIPAEFVDYEIDLATANGGSVVTFLTTDAVQVRAWAQCSYGVNQ